MATSLRYPKGHVFLDNDGNPAASGTIDFFRAGTTTDQDVFADAAEATALAHPISLNSAGRAVDGSASLVAIYLSDADGFDYKEVVKTSSGTVLWTDDNIPSPVDPTAGLTDFAKMLAAASTDSDTAVNLTAAGAGALRLANTASNSITYNLPSAASVGNGKFFGFKKISASNTVTLDAAGTDTIDGAATLAFSDDDNTHWIVSDGANWQVAFNYRTLASIFASINSLTEDTTPDPDADFLVTYDTTASGGKKVKPRNLALITSGTAQATTSGTSFDFTGIGATAKRVTVLFNEVSLSGTDDLLVQIGDSGGIENSAYVSSGGVDGATSNSTSGFIIYMSNAGRIFSGHMTITLVGSNLWIASHAGKVSTSLANFGGGSKTLSDTLDRVRILAAGANTFDGGSVNIIWE